MLLNKEILIGLYGSGTKKNITFNVSWNTYTTIITAYSPQVNENDRPRINTWRSDGSYIVYMSAGNQVYNFDTKTTSTPWGDRSTGLESITIPIRTSQTAGVDFFTDNRFPTPLLSPDISQWSAINTGNPNEIKYQYSVTKSASSIQAVSVDVYPPEFGATLYNFMVTTTAGSTEVFWGDNGFNTLNSGVPFTYRYYCPSVSASPTSNDFWKDITVCIP